MAQSGGTKPTSADLALTDEEKLERARERLLAGALGGKEGTREKRVAIVLNRYPETRDSDIKLQLTYWRLFDDYDGTSIEPDDLFELTPLTSLTRARAKIQNTYGLFQASAEVRRHRKQLSDDELAKARLRAPRFPTFAVYMDESGKSGPHIIVAAVWFGAAEDTLRVTNELARWRRGASFDKELHFKDLTDGAEPYYRQAIDVFLTEASSARFKAVSVPKAGIKRLDDAITEMFYHLIVEGVAHEHDTGRATLPRSVQVWKDAEERGRDKLILADLKDRVLQAGKTRFDGALTVDDFEAVDSQSIDLMQVADLFAASLNRRVNHPESKENAKTRTADYLLRRVGMPDGPQIESDAGDLIMHMQL